jgi:Ca2+:H+ antiporter
LAVSRGTSVILLLVYGLYLLFQLKSHAYMYESTPQAIIDEESHPGVLAELMDSSSSDDSSSSSSSDSDSSGSVRTAGKRFKRMIKNRRRRKSSVSTASTPSVPSVVSSPSTQDRQGSYWESTSHDAQMGTQQAVAADGDAEDADTEASHNNATRVRDFGGDSIIEKSHDCEPRKARKSKRHLKKRHHRGEEGAVDLEKPAADDKVTTLPPRVGPRVEFAEDIQPSNDQTPATQTVGKRPFNMRGLSTRAPTLRPGLNKMLSNNVFVTPPPRELLNVPPPMRTRSSGLRRTSSLPDRLNGQNATASAISQPVVSRHGPLPPFQHQVLRVNDADEDVPLGEDEKPIMSRTAAVMMLLISTALVAVCAEFMVDAIPAMIADSPNVSEAFIGLIVLPIVGNAAEHVTAVTVATKNKMDLAIGVAVGSSIQIALFVTPVVVLLGWILKTEMSLYFNLFETISLFVTVFVVNFLVLDGRSNYLEGSLLIAAYVIIALGAFYYPAESAQSAIGGGTSM